MDNDDARKGSDGGAPSTPGRRREMKRLDVRPPSDSRNPKRKARGGFLRAGFGCCDNGHRPVFARRGKFFFKKQIAARKPTAPLKSQRPFPGRELTFPTMALWR
jgi:hypothetical protein